MAETTRKKFPLPEQSTSPPDVVKWVTDGLQAVDDSVLSGPAASLPATLKPGQQYLGWA